MMRTAVILLAAGIGKRFSQKDTISKQFVYLHGYPVIRHATEAFLPHVDIIQPVGDPNILDEVLRSLDSSCILPTVNGGKERQDSVRAGLEALALLPQEEQPEIVLVHDGARPNISAEIIQRVINQLKQYPAAIPAIPVAETLKSNKNGVIQSTIPRENLFRAQTPQGFQFKPFLEIHRKASGNAATDDAALFEQAGLTVALVQGDENNIKLTYQEDLQRLECLMNTAMLPRIGTGFDVHAFVKGRPLIICGIEVPHEYGLAGHSDADVGLHALCDAIYGALAEGDIGSHFPPSNDQWKNADSKQFLIHAKERVQQRGGKIINIDLTLICERPKMRLFIDSMRQKIADLLEIDCNRISVKATTTEKLGFAGREEGIACQAMANILLPD